MRSDPVKLICGMIGVNADLLQRATALLTRQYGATDLTSADFPFTQTDYYRAEMGETLIRRFLAFRELIEPAALREIKRCTGVMERELAATRTPALRRRVNLDPGYIAPAKLVLASTKDFAHRVALGDGVYAEVTLNFSRQGCRFLPWTYPDFRSGQYEPFLLEARRILLRVRAKISLQNWACRRPSGQARKRRNIPDISSFRNAAGRDASASKM
jgi:hypothetical protein